MLCRRVPAFAAQIRSMLLSLWGHRYLVGRGYLDRREASSIYSSFLIVALSRARGGLEGSPSKGTTYILNHLLEARAISPNSGGRLVIDRAAADAAIARTTTEFVSLMAQGNATAIRSLLQRYVVITPAIRDLLPQLGPEPPPLLPGLPHGGSLEPAGHLSEFSTKLRSTSPVDSNRMEKSLPCAQALDYLDECNSLNDLLLSADEAALGTADAIQNLGHSTMSSGTSI